MTRSTRTTKLARASALVAFVLFAGGMDPAQNLYREARDGFEAYESGEFDAAAEHYAAASELAPEDPRTTYNLAAARARLGQMDDAERLWKRVAEDTSGRLRADAFFNRGLAALSQNRLRDAADHFVETLLFDPKDEEAKSWLAETLRRMKAQPPQQSPQSQEGQEGDDDEQQKRDESPSGQPSPPRNEKSGSGEEDRAGASRSPRSSEGDDREGDEGDPRDERTSPPRSNDESSDDQGRQQRRPGDGTGEAEDRDAAPQGAQAGSEEGRDANREIAERALARLEENEREALQRALEQRAREAGAKRKGKGW